jgi:colicin import membrane protein
MIFRRRRKNSILSFLISLVIHLAIIGFIITGAGYWYHAHQEQTAKQNKPQPKPIVKAVAVNQAAVENQIQSIKARAQMKRAKAIAWQQHLQDMAKKAVTQQESAQKLYTQVQASTQKLKEQAQTQLAHIKSLQAQAEAKLAELQTEQQTLSAQNTVVNKKLQATKQAIADEQSAQQKKVLKTQLKKEQAQKATLQQQQLYNQLSKYKTLILNDIGKQWIIPPGANKQLSSKLLVDLDAKGNVLNVKVIQSSGDPVLDRSAVTAVLKASPLPVPTSPDLLKQFKQIELTVKPEGLLNEQVNLS